MNQFTQAVETLQQYLDATNDVFKNYSLPNIETKIEFAMKILRDHEDYNGPNPQQ